MKRVIMLLIVASFLFISLAVGCSSNLGNSPSGVVREYYDAANNGDIDRALSVVDPDSMLRPSKIDLDGLDDGIERINIVDEEREKVYNVEAAIVTVEIYYTTKGMQEYSVNHALGDTYSIGLEKHEKLWKIEYINHVSSILGNKPTGSSQIYRTTTTITSSTQETAQGNVSQTINYSDNPKNPEEVVVTFLGLLNDKNTYDALLLTVFQEAINMNIITKGETGSFQSAFFQEYPELYDIEYGLLSNIEVIDKNLSEVLAKEENYKVKNVSMVLKYDQWGTISIVCYFKNGTQAESQLRVVRCNGVWLINFS